MSAGCIHKRSSVILAAGFMVGGLVTGNLLSAIEPAIGSLIGIFITPDLDVDRGFIGNKIIRNRLGYGAEAGWNLLWYFYKKSLKHGGPLSHFPGISTMFRLAYLFLFLLVIPYGVMELVLPNAWDYRVEIYWWMEFISEHRGVILGLAGSDLIHFFLDVLTSENSKQKTRREIFGLALASNKCK